jgi:hypothetical protein
MYAAATTGRINIVITCDFSSGPISDYTGEAYCRARFLEAFALALSEKSECSVFPDAETWTGFFYVAQDFADFMRALHKKVQEEEAGSCSAKS